MRQSIVNIKRKTTSEVELIENMMVTPLTKHEMHIANHRIRELYPMYNISITALFPYLCFCCSGRIKKFKKKSGHHHHHK